MKSKVFFSYNIDQQKQNKTKIYLFKFWISYAKYVLREKKGEREKEREIAIKIKQRWKNKNWTLI